MVKGFFKDDPWTQRFKELLGERGYVMIKSLQMQGLLLVLFTKREHLLHLREVETEYTRTGLGGMWVCTTYFLLLLMESKHQLIDSFVGQ